MENKVQICGAEMVFLVNILFEEVSLKASFEGRRNGRWWRANSSCGAKKVFLSINLKTSFKGRERGTVMESKRKSFKMCAAEKLFLVIILFEKVRLVMKAGFKQTRSFGPL